MTESPLSRPRWRRRGLLVSAGALGVGGAAAGVALGASGHQPLPGAVRLAAATTGGPAGADQAALRYFARHDPGPGTAQVQKTEPDVERGVPVYDVRVLAQNGTTYVVHVRQSNDTVFSANPAEHQTTAPPTTPSTAPPLTSPPVVTSPATSSPSAVPASPSVPATMPPQAPEPVETPEATATTAPATSSSDHSPDRSSTSTADAPDNPKPATSGKDN